MNAFKHLVKRLLPPILLDAYRLRFTAGIRFVGHYPSWEAARRASTGYDADSILERVTVASKKVQSGDAVYERDSVLFDEIEHSFPLLAVLMKAAAENDGKLTVLDFGGSLGSSYYQCKHFLPDNIELTWCVVEQENFVRRGLALFETQELKFFYTIQACRQQHQPNVILFASVLQYLEQADQVVDAAMDAGAEYIVVDRTPFVALESDWLCVQHVPKSIYEASYPCAMLSESRLKNHLRSRFDLRASFGALGGQGQIQCGLKSIPFEYKGIIWRRVKTAHA